ncbi:MAG TPA: hypothetical protein VHE99_03465 [Gammaproteobacteria bacterium]|nr:hypothetical protein [Gammaproteobacteria bacterium]
MTYQHREAKSKPISCIKYGVEDDYRLMAVIDGQAFYQSTGYNSSGYSLSLVSDLTKITLKKDTIYLSFIRDQEKGLVLQYRLFNPQGESVSGDIAQLEGCDFEELALSPDEAKLKLEDFLADILTHTYQKGHSHSPAKKRWIPFIMVGGTEPIDWENLPEIYNKYDIPMMLGAESLISKDPNYIVKSCDFLKQYLKDQEGIKENEHFSQFQATRIALKRFLITSSRLNPDSYSEQQLIDAGLNEQEISLARIPIVLDKNPPVLDDADIVNEWLIRQGATYIKNMLYPTPSIVDEITDSKYSKPKWNNEIKLKNPASLTFSKGWFEQKHKKNADLTTPLLRRPSPPIQTDNDKSTCCIIS